MMLKKANAVAALISIALLVAHVAYVLYAYITFDFNPSISRVLGWAFAAVVCVHAALGMGMVMFSHDAKMPASYPERNRRTIVQRASALGIVALLPVHVSAGALITEHRVEPPVFVLILVAQLVCWACVFLHIAASFSNAFVTLGLLYDMERKQKIDRVLAVICALAFSVTGVVVTQAQIAFYTM